MENNYLKFALPKLFARKPIIIIMSWNKCPIHLILNKHHDCFQNKICGKKHKRKVKLTDVKQR